MTHNVAFRLNSAILTRLRGKHVRTVRKFTRYTSVADTGCLSRIPDPNFFHPGYEIFQSRIRIKELGILTQEIVSNGVVTVSLLMDSVYCTRRFCGL